MTTAVEHSKITTRLLSGIQPSGVLHIGNYLGAIKNWLTLLDDYDCIFSIVDYHAISVDYEADEMQPKIFDVARGFIASGISPDRCTLFVQSDVPEHTELSWIFGTLTPLGMLDRMTQFKEKSAQHKLNINAGLYCYPILQASDILLYKAEAVPVGEDQSQHLELTREIARRFNARFGSTFPEPRTLLSEAPRVMGLDGKTKMSKTNDNYIALCDSSDTIWKKLSVAVTDPARKRRTDPGDPKKCNIFSLHRLFSTREEQAWSDQGCRTAGIGCIDCKKVLAANIDTELEPVREKWHDLGERPDEVRDALRLGAGRCRTIAAETMAEVRDRMGLGAR